MAKHDVAMRQGRAIFGQFLEPKDDGVRWGCGPGVLWRDFAARIDVALQRDRPDRALLHRDLDAA